MGIEVLGANHAISDAIRKQTSVRAGDEISLSDKEQLCDNLIKRINQEKLINGSANCSAVLYQDQDKTSKIYLILEIDEEENQEKWIRTNIAKNDIKLPAILDNLYNKLDAQQDSLFSRQKPTKETFANEMQRIRKKDRKQPSSYHGQVIIRKV